MVSRVCSSYGSTRPSSRTAPGVATKRIGKLPIIAITGIYSVLFVAVLLVFSLFNPAVAGPLGTITLVTVVGSFVLGIAVYFAMKAYHRSRGLDISIVFKEIPPE